MTSARPSIPPTNLRERIAALEQRNASNGGSTTRPTSPTPSVASTVSGSGQAAGALRDKIAKFERKGGVPVPRGSFGLGAPPTVGGPRRQGELYGNRIPAPARASSGSYMLGTSRAPSPVGSSTLGSPGSSPSMPTPEQRRSISLSSVGSDFDDHADYTPITSPTFAYPLDSPESLASVSYTPEASPSTSTNGDAPAFKYNIVRGTSFQTALEIARTAEHAKQEEAAIKTGSIAEGVEPVEDATTPTATQFSLDQAVEYLEHKPPVEAPIPIVVHESPAEEPSPELPVVNTAPAPELAAVVQPEATPAITVSAEDPTPPVLRESAGEESILTAPSASASSIPAVPEPQVQEPKVELVEDKPTILAPAVDIAPLTIRRRPLPAPAPAPTKAEAPPPAPAVVLISEKDQTHVEESVSNGPVVESTVKLPPPEIETVVLPPPEIVVHKEPAPVEPSVTKEEPGEITKNAEIAARKAALTLDADKIADESLMSPPMATGGMSAMSLTDVFNNYFTGGGKATGTFRSTSPPPVPKHIPESPLATLAYDVPSTPPPARPRVKAPDPSSFLSPPPSGFLSAVPSSGGSSMGSYSSGGSRPMSMIETSPGHVSRALRMTPATSRGVPMFLPANNSRPRKSDFVYFPPTPDKDETAVEEAEEEFGVVTLGHRRRGSEPDLANTSGRPMFRAVVHGKVRETPASATMPLSRPKPLPETPQIKRIKRATILEPPLSPGQGELAALLQEAVLLEDALDKGQLPGDAMRRSSQILEQKKRREVEARAMADAKAEEDRSKEEERQRIAYATAQLQAKRDQPTPGRLKHTFLMPLSKARSVHSVHRKEVSTSQAEIFPDKSQEEPMLRPRSAGLPDQPGTSSELGQAEQTLKPLRPKTPDTSAPLVPSKSPKSSRFASFKRLGSISRPNTINGHSTRHSNSTSSEISSEDSTAAVTPPDNTWEFGTRTSPVSEFGYMQDQVQSSATSFPSLSPKKSTGSMGRATSFAEKMWSRARTKSSGSTLSTASDLTDRKTPEPVPRLPALGPPPAIDLPSIPSVVLPFSDEEKRIFNPPSRSTSLKHPVELPPIPSTAPPLPTATPAQLPQTPTRSENDSLLLPGSDSSTRPSSWTSVSSAGSLPSPLFDEALFDAFPSVPGTTPTPATTLVHNFPHRRDISLASAAAATADFDSALLSSAIHLASSHKGATTPAAPTSSLASKRKTLLPKARRSGEATR